MVNGTVRQPKESASAVGQGVPNTASADKQSKRRNNAGAGGQERETSPHLFKRQKQRTYTRMCTNIIAGNDVGVLKTCGIEQYRGCEGRIIRVDTSKLVSTYMVRISEGIEVSLFSVE